MSISLKDPFACGKTWQQWARLGPNIDKTDASLPFLPIIFPIFFSFFSPPSSHPLFHLPSIIKFILNTAYFFRKACIGTTAAVPKYFTGSSDYFFLVENSTYC